MDKKERFKEEMKQFVKERNEALLSLDKEKIIAYIMKYNVDPYMPEEEIVFWAGVHKAILGIRNITDEQRECSRKWLRENGFKTDLDYKQMYH